VSAVSTVECQAFCWDLESTQHFDEIYLHHLGEEQNEFIAAFGACVLPELS
jgi:hypothetical protein